MQSSTDLVKLRDAVIKRVDRLRQVATNVHAPLGGVDRRAIAFAVIELDNLVVLGLRHYTKSCLLRSRTSTGARISASVRPTSTDQAAALIYKSLNLSGYLRMNSPATIPERSEIAFRDPKKVETVLTDYAASNLGTLQVALSLNADVFAEAKICRHFFAHRTENTFREVKAFAASMGMFQVESTEQLVLQGRPSTGVQFVDGWLSDIHNFFDLAT